MPRFRVVAAAVVLGCCLLVASPGVVAEADGDSVASPPTVGWLTLVPPLLAILLAILFRQVVPALLAGVWIGAWIGFGGPFIAVLRTLDHDLIGALADRDRLSISVFSMLLGGMVGVMSRSGEFSSERSSFCRWAG